jgi:hypothetical protein
MITGAYDLGSCVKFPEIRAANFAGIGVSVSTECAHLFSESAQDGDKVILLVWLGSVSKFQPGSGICWHCIYDAQDVWPRA